VDVDYFRCWPILLQKSQKAPRLIFRQRTKQATIADQCSLKPVIGVVRKFGARRRGSPTLLFDRRAYGSENLSPMPQKYFCNKIGTKRTFIQAIIDVCYRGYSGPHGFARRGPSLTRSGHAKSAQTTSSVHTCSAQWRLRPRNRPGSH
jgi:hypothetical protein